MSSENKNLPAGRFLNVFVFVDNLEYRSRTFPGIHFISKPLENVMLLFLLVLLVLDTKTVLKPSGPDIIDKSRNRPDPFWPVLLLMVNMFLGRFCL